MGQVDMGSRHQEQLNEGKGLSPRTQPRKLSAPPPSPDQSTRQPRPWERAQDGLAGHLSIPC